MTELAPDDLPTTAARAVPAEGARVGIVSCMWCGAALLLDRDDPINVVTVHRRWHDRNDTATP